MTPDQTPMTRASRIAWAHIWSQTLAGATITECIACTATPAVSMVLERLARAKASGDVRAVQQIFQSLNKAYRTALEQMRQQEAA